MNPLLTPARLRRLAALAALPLAGLLAAACSSGSGSATTTTTTTAAAAPSTTATTAGAQAVVKTMNVSGVGTILVNAQGQVVYTLTNGGANVHCSAACLTVWPAVTLPTGVSTPTGPAAAGTLGTTTSNGPTQVTVGGLPIFTFAGDPGPGQAKGNNLTSFGGTWKVVKAQ
ncbi:MAG TPA: hypothetical protein VID75_02820 [Acidimicrobiales bacterium]|jgi:predicted lipoprotein with Yx(FWY)xxD motif